MQEVLQQVVSGIASGGIFASLALALVLIYNAMGLVNFAQGEMAMFATFIAFTLIDHGLSYWIAVPATLVIAFAGGVLIQRVVIRPVERAPVLTLVIVTLGLATLFNGLAGFVFGYVPRSFPSPFSVQTVTVLGAIVSFRDLGVIGVSALVLVLIYLLLQRTTLGLSMRAAAHNPDASRLLGVRVSWMLALGWGLASAVGALSGIMVAPILLLEPNMMQTIIIYAFAAAVLGGIESPLGAVIGGLIVGVTVNLAGAYLVGGDLQLAVAFLIIVAVLVAFGRHQLSEQPVDAGAHLRDRDHGSQRARRLQRADLARPRGLHGAWRVHERHPDHPLPPELLRDDSDSRPRDRRHRFPAGHSRAAPFRPVPRAGNLRAGRGDAEPDQASRKAHRRGPGHPARFARST